MKEPDTKPFKWVRLSFRLYLGWSTLKKGVSSFGTEQITESGERSI